MASFTRCSANRWTSALVQMVLALPLLLGQAAVQAQTQPPAVTEISQVRVERSEDDILVSAQIQLELPAAVEDALTKGIPLYFVLEADVLRDRWYWYDKKISSSERHFRVAYQPLTRRWRANATTGPGSTAIGLALNQSFDSLAEAMAAVKRVARWRISAAADVEGLNKLRLEMRFRLDLTQLPRPFQIGTLGQSDWDIAATVSLPLTADMLR